MFSSRMCLDPLFVYPTTLMAHPLNLSVFQLWILDCFVIRNKAFSRILTTLIGLSVSPPFSYIQDIFTCWEKFFFFPGVTLEQLAPGGIQGLRSNDLHYVETTEHCVVLHLIDLHQNSLHTNNHWFLILCDTAQSVGDQPGLYLMQLRVRLQKRQQCECHCSHTRCTSYVHPDD